MSTIQKHKVTFDGIIKSRFVILLPLHEQRMFFFLAKRKVENFKSYDLFLRRMANSFFFCFLFFF